MNESDSHLAAFSPLWECSVKVAVTSPGDEEILEKLLALNFEKAKA